MSDEVSKTGLEDANKLTSLILEGRATEEQLGVAGRLMGMALSVDLIHGQKQLRTSIQPLVELQETIIKKLSEGLTKKLSMLDLDSISDESLEALIKTVESIHNMSMKSLDLERKIVQGKELFSGTILSEEEKALVDIFKSFRTTSEKKTFVEKLQEIKSEIQEF